MNHPPLYTLPFAEVKDLALLDEPLVSAAGYLLSGRDRKFDEKYAYYVWSADVDNAIFKGLLRPEDNPKGAAAPANIKENTHAKTSEKRSTVHDGKPQDKVEERAGSKRGALRGSSETSQAVTALNKKGKPFSWSFTALTNFEGCSARYAAEKFYCTTQWVDTPQIIWGNRVHGTSEDMLKGKPVTDLEAYEPVRKYVEAFLKQRVLGADVIAEQEIALTRDMKPVSWFAKDAWFRVKLDVVIVRGNVANLYDYKTGKFKDDPDQLKICAAAHSIVRPDIDVYNPKYIWTKDQVVSGCDAIAKKDIPGIWEGVLGRVARMEQAWAAENFPARPSGLCPWCPIYDTCTYAKRR
jgi:hypothetical protein